MEALIVFKIFAMVLSAFAVLFCGFSGIKPIMEKAYNLGVVCLLLAFTNAVLFAINALYFVPRGM